MSAELEPLATLETATFRAGDVVVLRPREPMSHQAHQRLRDHAAWLHQETGVRFVVLHHDIDVVVPVRELEVPT